MTSDDLRFLIVGLVWGVASVIALRWAWLDMLTRARIGEDQ